MSNEFLLFTILILLPRLSYLFCEGQHKEQKVRAIVWTGVLQAGLVICAFHFNLALISALLTIVICTTGTLYTSKRFDDNSGFQLISLLVLMLVSRPIYKLLHVPEGHDPRGL